MRISCKKGPSSVDAIILMNYFFSPEELEIIESGINEHKLDFSVKEVCRILLTNAIKSIPATISEIMEIDYRIFIEKIENYEQKEGFQLMIRAVGRIG